MASLPSTEDILQDILNHADEIVKAVLAVYQHEEDHEVNQEALCKLTVDYLERCAVFLKIKYRTDDNKRLYVKAQLL